MCPKPKMTQIKSIIPQAPAQVDEAPKPIEIDKDGQKRTKRRSNPLRIDLAGGGGGGPTSGVSI